jgi:methylmalonyl-CoA mutase cobalamin-binding subunit
MFGDITTIGIASRLKPNDLGAPVAREMAKVHGTIAQIGASGHGVGVLVVPSLRQRSGF